MNEYEDYCRKFVEYMGGDINSDEYKIYMDDPFPRQIWNDKEQQLKETQAKLEKAEEVIRYFAELDDDDIERCHGFQAKHYCENYFKEKE